MKGLVSCVCVSIFAFQLSSTAVLKQRLHDADGNFENAVATCWSEYGMSPNDMYKKVDLMANIHTEPGNEERTRKNGCLVACVMKKQNLVEGTNIKEEKVIEQLGEIFEDLNAEPIVRKCMEEARNITQECEKGFSLYLCMAKTPSNNEEHKKDETTENAEKE